MTATPAKMKVNRPAAKKAVNKAAEIKARKEKTKKVEEKKEAPKKAEKKVDANQLTVVQVATDDCGMDPKVARAKLRRAGKASVEGRWPTVTKGSKEHQELIAFLKGKTE